MLLLNNEKKSKTKVYIILFFVALFLRLFIFFYLYESRGASFFDPLKQGTDQAEYGRLTINIVDSGKFSMNKEPPFSPDPARTPIFPIFLSIGYLIGGGFVLSTILNIFFGSVISILVFELAMLILKNKRLSFLSAIIFSSLPYGIYLSSLIMADTLFTFLFIFFLILFEKKIIFDNKANYKIIVASSFLLGLATLTRPITQFFAVIPVVVLMAICFFKEKTNLKHFLIKPLLFLVVFLLVLSPWLGRNYYHFKKIFLSSIGGYHTMVSYVAPWMAQKENISRSEEHSKIKEYINEKYGQNAMYNIEASSKIGEEAKKEILSDPLSYGLFHLSVMPIYFLNNDVLLSLREVFGVNVPNFYLAKEVARGNFVSILKSISEQGLLWVFIFLLSYMALFFKAIFGIGGIILYMRKNFIAGSFFLATIFYFPIIIGPEGHARFRLPIEPILIIFSVFFVMNIYYFLSKMAVLKQNDTIKN